MKVEAAMSDDELLTTSAAARIFDRTPDTIRNWERIGVLPAIKTSTGQRLFRRSDVARIALERRSVR